MGESPLENSNGHEHQIESCGGQLENISQTQNWQFMVVWIGKREKEMNQIQSIR